MEKKGGAHRTSKAGDVNKRTCASAILICIELGLRTGYDNCRPINKLVRIDIVSDDLSGDDQSLIERALKSMRSPNRRKVPSEKVKLFLLMLGDELNRTGSLPQDYVEKLLSQVKSGAI